jgi:hypothetical protein
MNERIRQLTEQCYEHDQSWTGVGQRIFNKEKFAELIVRECAKKGFDIFDEEPDAPASDLQFYVRDRIKEHFGVES